MVKNENISKICTFLKLPTYLDCSFYIEAVMSTLAYLVDHRDMTSEPAISFIAPEKEVFVNYGFALTAAVC